VKALRRHSQKAFDVHLMIAPCDPYIEAFAKAGADIITLHVESGPHIHRSLQAVRALGKKAGVTLNPGTHESAIEPVIDLVDLILVMSVNPGFGGQAFIPAAADKIARAARARGGRRSTSRSMAEITPETPRRWCAPAPMSGRGLGRVQGGKPENYRANIAAIRGPRRSRAEKAA